MLSQDTPRSSFHSLRSGIGHSQPRVEEGQGSSTEDLAIPIPSVNSNDAPNRIDILSANPVALLVETKALVSELKVTALRKSILSS
jgi:hypothetical protein